MVSISLVYPPSPAPRLRVDDVERVGAEMLPVVDEHGFVIGQASRNTCHGGAMFLHPVVHLHVINRFGQVYLQHRDADRLVCPLMWDTAVGGHVSYGEQPLEALYREASEELNFTEFNAIFLKTYNFKSAIDNELVHVFAAVGNFEINPIHDEVLEGRYWSPEEIDAAYGEGVLTPNFELEFADIRHSLFALL